MAMIVHQREIVEVPFEMPDGRILTHMALVLSADDIQNYEEGLFYAVLISSKNHFELTIPIQNAWLNKPLSKQSFFVTHIVKDFNVSEVINRYNNFIKADVFPSLVKQIVENIANIEL